MCQNMPKLSKADLAVSLPILGTFQSLAKSGLQWQRLQVIAGQPGCKVLFDEVHLPCHGFGSSHKSLCILLSASAFCKSSLSLESSLLHLGEMNSENRHWSNILLSTLLGTFMHSISV